MIDTKILKEFLRLKWNETNWILILIPSIALMLYAIYWMQNNSELLIVKIIMAILVIGWCGLILFLLFKAIRELIKWLKSNWKQATKNVYPPKRERVTTKSAYKAAEKTLNKMMKK